MIKRQLIFAVITFAALTAGAHAASNGCDKDNNEYINPDLALCSAHAYNIGLGQNPETPGDRQVMDQVVAMKTTIMTQQMKKQYDYLEATIKRFKTQLEKAILVAKMEAAGAAPGAADAYGATGAASADRTIILQGAENCRLKTSTSAALECLQNNIRITRNAIATNNIGQAKRQLDEDLKVAGLFEITDIADCAKLSATRNIITPCLDSLNVSIIRKIEANSRATQSNNRNSNNY